MKTFVLGVSLLLAVATVQAAELRVAVAANFNATLERLGEAYERETGTRLVISSASSGKHFAQIVQGAPFDVFFSADAERPADLVAGGQAIPESRFVYAEGVLALWSTDPALIGDDAVALLKGGGYPRLAIANPRVAPYGAAAQAVLDHHGVVPRSGRVVTGQSIGQTFNFITTGNARLGFVALSQVIIWERNHAAGSRWIPEAATYPPIVQEAVALRSARDAQAALAFLEWVGNNAVARGVIESDGYRLPAR